MKEGTWGKKTSKYTQILDGLLNYTCGRDWEGLLKTSTWEVQIYKAEISAVAYIKGKQFGLWGHPKLSASTKINTLQRKITESRVSTMFCPKHPLQKDKINNHVKTQENVTPQSRKTSE